ncbi:putative methyltransferase domain containing protein [Trypanosoma cruzi]|nr:putative methyltransferase domain containing protein [Trypanosoma cruzi]
MHLLACFGRQYAAKAAMYTMSGADGGVTFLASSYSFRRASTAAATTSGPVVYRSLHDCQNHVRRLIEAISLGFAPTAQAGLQEGESLRKSHRGARTLMELQELAEQFVVKLQSTVFLPSDVVQEVDDFPMFLLRYFHHAVGRAKEGRPRSEEEIIEGFMEWMDMALPASPSSGREEEFVSFVELMRLVQSFVRYHRGVRWGGGITSAEWHRNGYLLHPWHGTYCPSLHTEQMPYVHLLQWLLRRRPVQEEKGRLGDADKRNTSNGDSSMRDDTMRWWSATEPFAPPSWRDERTSSNTVGFAALDCGCHSGYMTDLLLKAGAQHVIAVDVSAHALGSAEATLREHLRERRSATSVAKRVQFIRCDLLPELGSVAKQEEGEMASPLMEERSTLVAAAARRRLLARKRFMRDNPQVSVSSFSEVTAAPESEFGPFDLLVFHPPVKPLFPSWPLLQESLNVVEYSPPIAEDHHSHSSLSALHEFLQRLLYSSKDHTESSTQPQSLAAPLLKDGGYVAFIIPVAFDPKDILQHISLSQLHSSSRRGDGGVVSFTSLSDAVTGLLEGPYELVVRRRHSLAGMCNTGEEFPLCDMAYLREFADPQCRDRIKQELNAFYRTYQAVDLLVLRKKPSSKESNKYKKNEGNSRNENHTKDHFPADPKENPITYEESFEHTEYIPADGPSLRHHWTEMTPSYSYLEDEFFDSNVGKTKRNFPESNFLAVGHTPSLVREEVKAERTDGEWSHANLQTVRRSLRNYRSLFTGELKMRRKKRLRKMALQSLENQEWYIDEKLVKSEGAKIDLLNELSRFDLQDWD